MCVNICAAYYHYLLGLKFSCEYFQNTQNMYNNMLHVKICSTLKNKFAEMNSTHCFFVFLNVNK